MWIAWSSGNVLGGRYEGGDFDLDLGAFIDQARDVEQRRGREIFPQRFAPGSTDAGTRRLVFAAAGQIAAANPFHAVSHQCNPLRHTTDSPCISHCEAYLSVAMATSLFQKKCCHGVANIRRPPCARALP